MPTEPVMIRHAKHVERARCGGFGQSVAFVDRHPAPRKNANNSGSSGAPPATIHWRVRRAPHAARHRPSDRTPRDAWGKRSGLPLGADFLHIVLRGDHGCGESNALGAMTGLLGSSVVHLLQHTRNNDHDGRLGHLQIGGQCLDAAGDINMEIACYADVVDGTGEGMRLEAGTAGRCSFLSCSSSGI